MWYKRLFVPLLLVFLFNLTFQASADTIGVEDGCTLADAIRAANNDAPVGGCTGGSAGRDVITLSGDVILTARAEGSNGLPVIRSAITIRGNGYSIIRSEDAGTPQFRLIEIDADGDLILEAVTLRGGRLSGGNGGRGTNGTGVGEDGESGDIGSAGFLIGGVGGEGGTGGVGTRGGAGAGGGTVHGGAIYNAGTLELRECAVEDNAITGGRGGAGGTATLGGEGGEGGTGGIPWTLIGMLGPGGVGGLGGPGGTGGRGGLGGTAQGGAIFNAGGSVTINSCSFSDNRATGGVGGTGGRGGIGGGGGIGGFTNDYEVGPGGMGGRGGAGGTGGRGGTASGGAIYNASGELLITRTQFMNNLASSGRGGAGGAGNRGGEGGLEQGDGGLGGPGGTGGTSGAAQGGAVATAGGELTITRSIFEANVAQSGIGGNGGDAGMGGTGGSFVVNLTTFGDREGTIENFRNLLFAFFGTGGFDGGGPGGTGGDGGRSGISRGGAIYNRDGSLTLTRSTIYDGAAQPGAGGAGGEGSLGGFGNEFIELLGDEGIIIRTPSGDGIAGQPGMTEGGGSYSLRGMLLIERSTVTGNEASTGGGIASSGVGEQLLVSSTISGNHAITSGGGVSAGQMTVESSIVAGNSIAGSGEIDLNVGEMTGVANVIGGDPRLSGLGNYGGGVPTLALFGGSPAVNRGWCSDTTDQRGYFIVDNRCDAGAFELGATATRPTPLDLIDSLPGRDGDAIRVGLPDGSFANVIAVDGRFVRTSGEIGNTAVIARGVIAAVDVFTLNGESAAGAIICFAGEGELIFLSAADAPRAPRSIAARQREGYTCTILPNAGMLVLVRSA